MKITLIHGKYFNSWEALGLGYLGGYLKKMRPGVRVEFFQGSFDDEATIVDACRDSDIAAFSTTTPTMKYCVDLAGKIKAVNPNIRTVVGGYHPSADPGSCRVAGIDQVVTGEGETALLKVVDGDESPLLAGENLPFSELAWPDRELLKNERNIAVAYKDNKKNITSFQSHRACPFMCKYCLDGHNKVLYGFVRKAPVRYRDVKDLLDEMEAVTGRYGLDLIKFCDPTWNTHIDWVKEFCREKIRRGFKTPFYPNMHATMVSKEMIDLMAKAGCYEFAMGVESGSPKILRQIGKGTNPTTIKRCAQLGKEAGIIVRGYFILGMPDETHEDLEMTEALAEEMELDEYGFTILCPYPGTQMYDREKFKDVKWEETDEYSNDFWRTNHLTNQELRDWQSRLKAKFGRKLTWHNRVLSAGKGENGH